MSDEYRDVNKAMWDERVPIHVASEYYDVEGFLAGRSDLRAFERGELGDVRGLNLVHLQCHFGLDTLSWAREGAHVAGLDFSAPAIEAARDVAARAGIDADFVAADVYDAPQAFPGRRFDVVYTGLGALNWLPDIERWAQVVASLLEPGGRLYLVEFHPLTNTVFGDETLEVTYPYFKTDPFEWNDPGTYADLTAKTTHNRSIEFQHTLGDIVTAVVGAGLRLEWLHEHDHTLFERWPCLVRHEDRTYRLPEGTPSLPLMFSLLAAAA
jgi:SAM-dependent methyltransferase